MDKKSVSLKALAICLVTSILLIAASQTVTAQFCGYARIWTDKQNYGFNQPVYLFVDTTCPLYGVRAQVWSLNGPNVFNPQPVNGGYIPGGTPNGYWIATTGTKNEVVLVWFYYLNFEETTQFSVGNVGTSW